MLKLLRQALKSRTIKFNGVLGVLLTVVTALQGGVLDEVLPGSESVLGGIVPVLNWLMEAGTNPTLVGLVGVLGNLFLRTQTTKPLSER